MKYKWIEELEELGKEEWGRLFDCPYCAGKWFVEYEDEYSFKCQNCGFVFIVPEEELRKIYEELKEE